MEYRAIEYQLVQTANPCCWKWTIFLDATRTRTGISLTRADAVLDAERAIDAVLENGDRALSRSTSSSIKLANPNGV